MLPLLLLLQAPALQTPAPDITVVGRRLLDQQAECRRQACTPLRDAQVSVAIAEVQFRAGRYLDAKRTLAAAVARQRDHAAIAPKPVAALYEAYATAALHEGDRSAFQRAVAGRVRTLRDHLPADDPAVVAATPALGDMWLKLGDYRQADAAYRAAEEAATAAGQARAALLVAMTRASLVAAGGREAQALRMIGELEARPAAGDPVIATVLRVVRFRIAARNATDAEMARLVRAIGPIGDAAGQQAPALLWEPPYPGNGVATRDAVARRFGEIGPLALRSSDVDDVQWIDVGFWIRPDGRTADAEILRGAGSGSWGGAILAQIEGRRYAPSPASAGAGALGGIYRVERVTRRSTYAVPIGSTVRRRVAADGFEKLDLTDLKAGPG